jgi:Fe-S oxidoreductase
MKKEIAISDISKRCDQLTEIDKKVLIPLPYPYEHINLEIQMNRLSEEEKTRYEASLDGISAIGMPKPKSKREEDELVRKFLSGLKKLFSEENNWTFLQPLTLSLEYCGKCLTCSEACPIYVASGKQEIYRPAYRSELLRRIKEKYLDKTGKITSWFKGNNIELNWLTIARLGELAYRCTLCRRCAQVCSRGIDNGLISREIRKLFSQEMGIAPKELHEKGTMQQLEIGSTTGMSPVAFKDVIEFMEEEIHEKTGKKIRIPIDKKGADILLIHNAGEYLSWPENPEAFFIIFEAAGLDWTLSSELVGYDAVNFGVWYDDIQLSRIAFQHAKIAKSLNVKRIVIGECGHAHKAFITVADRILTGDLNIPRESCLTLLDDILQNGKLKLEPKKNNFPITLHDPCNLGRLMGIVEPQRRILREVCPQFREMAPHGVENYCCGGGSGFTLMSSRNFPYWRSTISGRMKLKQILEAFQDVITPEIPKYVCAPCSSCKAQIRGLFNDYQVWEKCSIYYGGIVELIANAMVDIRDPFINWEWR